MIIFVRRKTSIKGNMGKISVASLSARKWALALMGLLFSFSALAGRDVRTLNDGWKFYKGECAEAIATDFDDNGWETVHLPHTWNADAYVVKNYYQGIGWYRRKVSVPSGWTGKQIFLKMEGAGKAAEIYLNGKQVGEHAGGYTACVFDLTPYLSFQTENLLAIRVDNSRQDIPPISGDFTFFGGIYRDVWLIATEAQHINLNDMGAEGVRITTPRVSEEEGTINIRTEVKNDADKASSLRLSTSIYAPDGSLLQTLDQSFKVKAGETFVINQESKSIKRPCLWTPETPHLYQVIVELKDSRNNEVIDVSRSQTAFRWYHFDGQKGFFLNGKPYKLRGVCRHQDQKPIGPALSDEMHRRDFRLMKEMGANFIRISHYPQDEALLELCDKEGMLAWEEIPVIDIVRDTPGYGDTCERNLREMIRQHYNHPSIILWGYMNEILLVTQRTYKTEAEMKPALERTLALANRLERALKEEDPTRLSTMAFHGSNSYNEVGLSQITDVVGWNLYNGWYGGDVKGFDRFLEEQQTKYPNHPLIVSEYGAGSDKRLHSLSPRAFDFSSEYQQFYLEHYLPVLEQTPYVCGGTHWNFIDFSSALRDESMPRINNKGLVRADRTPKDVYYYYQAMWREDIPVLHIATRDWSKRCGIQQGDAPVYLPVKVYANLSEVELFVDGQSLGKQQVENRKAVFNVPFTGKAPYLSACGEYQGRKVWDGTSVSYQAVPSQLNDDNLRSLELAINVGSNCFFTSDESGLTWVPDQPYTAGSWGYVGGKEQSTQTQIHLTADGPLYQTLREGLEEYRFDVPRGVYEVEVLLADIFRKTEAVAYQLGRDGKAKAGRNHFKLLCNGVLLEDLAPGETNGYFQAIRKKYVVCNDTDHLSLSFQSVSGKCFLNAIKLRRIQ